MSLSFCLTFSLTMLKLTFQTRFTMSCRKQSIDLHWSVLVFPRLSPVACFPTLSKSCMFSCARYKLYVFSRLAPVTCFSALGTSCMFSRARHKLYFFLRLAQVVCFPTPGTCCRVFLLVLICSLHCWCLS